MGRISMMRTYLKGPERAHGPTDYDSFRCYAAARLRVCPMANALSQGLSIRVAGADVPLLAAIQQHEVPTIHTVNTQCFFDTVDSRLGPRPHLPYSTGAVVD